MTPDHADAHFERGLLLYQQDRHAAAEAELRLALAGDPDHAPAHAVLACCLADQGKLDPAAAEADRAVGVDPGYAFGHYARGLVFYKRKRPAEAEAAVREALRLDPTEAASYALLAQLRLDRRDPAGAVRAAEEGLAHDPNHAGCSALRTIALLRQGKAGAAGEESAAALRRDPEDTLAHAGRGWALLHEKRPKEALTHFREALRLDPTNEWARIGMVEALKARHWLYRQMLGFFLWLGRFGNRAQWGIILGLLVVQQVLAGIARNNPAAAPYLYPVLYAFFGFLLLSWLADPLFNLLLRLNRFGRLVLDDTQVRQSNWVFGVLLVAVAAAVPWAFGGGPIGLYSILGETTTVAAVMFLLPVAAAFKVPAGWPRRLMATYAAGMVAGWAYMVGCFFEASQAITLDGVRQAAGAGWRTMTALIWAGLGSTFLANLFVIDPRR